jgi:hypothetical protein
MFVFHSEMSEVDVESRESLDGIVVRYIDPVAISPCGRVKLFAVKVAREPDAISKWVRQRARYGPPVTCRVT